MEEAIAFTNQAFELLIQEVLRVDVWNGNYTNHLNRYGLDEMLDELVNYSELGGDYREELERLIMISITKEYIHRIKQFLTDNNLIDDQTSLDIANEIIEDLKVDG